MKKTALFIAGVIWMLTMAGCVTVSKYEKERVDQQLKGNRGFINGNPPSFEENRRSQTRTVYEVEIELPPLPKWERIEKNKKDIQGNRGYLEGGAELKKSDAK